MNLNTILHIVHWERSGVYELVNTLIKESENDSELNHKLVVLRREKIKFPVVMQIINSVKVVFFIWFNYKSIRGIHAHSFLPSILLIPIVKRRIIITIHNDYPFLSSNGLKARLKKSILSIIVKKMNTKLTVVNEALNPKIEEVFKLKSVYIENAIDHEFFYLKNCVSGRRASFVNERRVTFGALGRFNYQKNFLNLLIAFSCVVRKFPETKLIIGGDGPEREKAFEMLVRYGLDENVELLGHISDNVSFFKNIDCFVQVSRYEGFGLVVVEAAASGVPIIATPVGIAGAQAFRTLHIGFEPCDIEDGIKEFIGNSKSYSDWMVLHNLKVSESDFSPSACYQKYRRLVWMC